MVPGNNCNNLVHFIQISEKILKTPKKFLLGIRGNRKRNTQPLIQASDKIASEFSSIRVGI